MSENLSSYFTKDTERWQINTQKDVQYRNTGNANPLFALN